MAQLKDSIRESFGDFDRFTVLIIAFDLITFFLFRKIIISWFGYIDKVISNFPGADELMLLSPEQLHLVMSSDPASLIRNSIIYMFLGIIAVFFVSRCIIWMFSGTSQLSLSEKGKLMGINLLWYLALIPGLIIFFIMKIGPNIYFMIIYLLIFIHFTISLNLRLLHVQDIHQIKYAVKTGVKNIHLFLISYVIYFVMTYIVIKIMSLFVSNLYLSLFVAVVLLCWLRYFMLRFVK